MGIFGRSNELRSRISEDDFGGLRIVIPSHGNWFTQFFLMFWLCGWAVGEVIVSAMMIASRPTGFLLLIWLIPWTIGGGLAFSTLLWNFVGREVVLISKAGVEVRREVGPFSRSKQIDGSKIRSLRYSPILHAEHSRDLNQYQSRRRRVVHGGITFDYESDFFSRIDSLHFGFELQEMEARRLILTIRQRFDFPEEPELEPLPILSR
jgi:hypothetical protein